MEEVKLQVRAGCYCRISSDPKDKREGVQRQREDTTALCEVKNWRVADFYIDNDKSASNGKGRPEWDRLLADIEAGRIDAIAAWDQDRGWRVMDELEQLRKFFNGLDRHILLATTGQGDIDLYSPTGVMMSQIKTAVSEHEIAMMRVRMRRAARQRAEKGIPKWKRAFGYDEHRQPDPTTAPLVQRVYVDVLAGGSISDAARMLNAANAIGLNGKPWTPSTLSLFLRAPRNAGLRSHTTVINGKPVAEILGKGTWPALVDESTWRAVQSVVNAPGRSRPKTVRKHLLTGVLKCGKEGCGGHLSGAHTAQGRITYVCKGCRGVSIRAEHVEPLVYGIISGRLAQPDAVDLLKKRQCDEAEADAVRTQRLALVTRLDEIADERAEGLIDGRGYRRMVDKINADLADLDARQHDSDRVRVLDGLPLGQPEVEAAVKQLSADRLRAVVDVLCEFVVRPVGKGHRPQDGDISDGNRFDPDRVVVVKK